MLGSLGRPTASGRCAPSAKIRNEKIGGGLSVAASMPKSVLSCVKESMRTWNMGHGESHLIS